MSEDHNYDEIDAFVEILRPIVERCASDFRERAAADPSSTVGFRGRLKFRVSKRLKIDATEFNFRFGDYKAKLTPVEAGAFIGSTNWLVLIVQGIQSEADAHKIGKALVSAISLASARYRLGVDLGPGAANSSFAAEIVERVYQQFGVELRADKHGYDFYRADRPVSIPNLNVDAIVSTPAEPVLTAISEYGSAPALNGDLADSLRLLNAAIYNTDPLARLVLAISAIESLSQKEKWTPAQKELLQRLEAAAGVDSETTIEEREEVAQAIKLGMYKVSLRQGVKRFLHRVGLESNWNEWDDIYSLRSAVVHGGPPPSPTELDELANRAVAICGRVLLTLAAQHIPNMASNIESYPPPIVT